MSCERPAPGCLPRLGRSFQCALAGCAQGLRGQRNLRIHLAFVVAITVLALYLQVSLTQWAILALTYSLVMAAELLNSALEALTDLVSPKYHPLARQAKDLAAGAVLVTAIGAVAVGLLILGPPLWAKITLWTH